MQDYFFYLNCVIVCVKEDVSSTVCQPDGVGDTKTFDEVHVVFV